MKLSSVRLPACAEALAGKRRLSDFSRGAFLAAAGGENGSDYFKNTGQKLKQANGLF
ncbi:MAG: hypothetical protein HYX20_04105 [Candidatus Yanofskybacteria bacterium]|nr:hypothetical protein [Candidatus Yanofskybacteria bacterium]